MTTGTYSNYFIMIYSAGSNRCPVCREYIVASIAQVTGIDMTGVLATGRDTIVAGNTVVHKSTVINGGNRRPVCCDMTAITFQCRLKMSAAFTLCINIIVTA